MKSHRVHAVIYAIIHAIKTMQNKTVRDRIKAVIQFGGL